MSWSFNTTKFGADVHKRIDIQAIKTEMVALKVESAVFVKGNGATAEAVADANGFDTISRTDTFTYTDPYSSSSLSESVSGTGFIDYSWY